MGIVACQDNSRELIRKSTRGTLFFTLQDYSNSGTSNLLGAYMDR